MRFLALAMAALALAGCAAPPPATPPPGPGSASTAVPLAFAAPVDLHMVGYEPGIAVDQLGTIYLTAHKDLMRPETWPYPGSWFELSRDQGKTWETPASPGNVHQAYLGDEGDIGIDARGWVYFVDTYLADNHLHVWSDQGKTWQSSEPVQKTTGEDDRPWITAQGQGIVHYLGNNGQPVNGGRVWYYRSADAGLTWSQGTPIAGNGWTTIDAERGGQNVYIANEETANGPGKILAYASHDSGATWGQAVTVGTRAGYGREYPLVSVAPDGLVWVLWMDCGTQQNCADNGGGQQNDTLVLARSADAGATWQSWNLTTPGFADFPALAAGPNGTVAVAYYGADAPVKDGSEWALYAAMARPGANGTPDLRFQRAAPEAVYKGKDLHALHDFFEIAIGPDEALDVSYMHSADAGSGALPVPTGVPDYGVRQVFFVRGQQASG
jgi:hypothetical protein